MEREYVEYIPGGKYVLWVRRVRAERGPLPPGMTQACADCATRPIRFCCEDCERPELEKAAEIAHRARWKAEEESTRPTHPTPPEPSNGFWQRAEAKGEVP